MTHRQKNLLEAFSASAAVEKAASAERDGATVGGPFAPESTPDAAEPEFPSEKPGLGETLLQPENRGGLLILLGLGLTLAFLAGRASKGGTVAAKDDEPSIEETRPASTAPTSGSPTVVPIVSAEAANEPAAGRSLSAAELALADPTNRFTIKLCEYEVDRDEDLAWPNFNYLEDLGLPVAMIQRGQRLFIVIGAAAQQAELDDQLAQAKSMAGPPPRSKSAEFSDAYVVMIDSVLDR